MDGALSAVKDIVSTEAETFAPHPRLGHVLIVCARASSLGQALTATTLRTNLL